MNCARLSSFLSLFLWFRFAVFFFFCVSCFLPIIPPFVICFCVSFFLCSLFLCFLLFPSLVCVFVFGFFSFSPFFVFSFPCFERPFFLFFFFLFFVLFSFLLYLFSLFLSCPLSFFLSFCFCLFLFFFVSFFLFYFLDSVLSFWRFWFTCGCYSSFSVATYGIALLLLPVLLLLLLLLSLYYSYCSWCYGVAEAHLTLIVYVLAAATLSGSKMGCWSTGARDQELNYIVRTRYFKSKILIH